MYWQLAENLLSQHFSLVSTYFNGVIWSFLLWLKYFIPVEKSSQNAGASQLGCKVNETRIWPSLGAMLTTSLKDMFVPSVLYIRIGKATEDSSNLLSLQLSLNTISSLSVWWLQLDFLTIF